MADAERLPVGGRPQVQVPFNAHAAALERRNRLPGVGCRANTRLSYTWDSSGDEAGRLNTVVSWTLTPTEGGTLVRMEQSGFRPDNEEFYRGASYGWQEMVAGLERVAAGLD